MDSDIQTRPSRSELQHQLNQQQLHLQHQPKLWRKLQVQKSTALGLVVPCANLQLEVRHVDRADQDLGPAFRTNNLNWVECFVTMLPKFDLFPVTLDDNDAEKAKPLATVSRPLFNYFRKTLADISTPFSTEKSWEIKQHPLQRHYNLISNTSTTATETFTWKGSKHVLTHLADHDYNPRCHGNLKLLANDGTLLAAWKQQRTSKVLGSIHVFEAARERVLPVEVIVASCLCVVIVERTAGVTWFGGM